MHDVISGMEGMRRQTSLAGTCCQCRSRQRWMPIRVLHVGGSVFAAWYAPEMLQKNRDTSTPVHDDMHADIGEHRNLLQIAATIVSYIVITTTETSAPVHDDVHAAVGKQGDLLQRLSRRQPQVCHHHHRRMVEDVQKR